MSPTHNLKTSPEQVDRLAVFEQAASEMRLNFAGTAIALTLERPDTSIDRTGPVKAARAVAIVEDNGPFLVGLIRTLMNTTIQERKRTFSRTSRLLGSVVVPAFVWAPLLAVPLILLFTILTIDLAGGSDAVIALGPLLPILSFTGTACVIWNVFSARERHRRRDAWAPFTTGHLLLALNSAGRSIPCIGYLDDTGAAARVTVAIRDEVLRRIETQPYTETAEWLTDLLTEKTPDPLESA